MLAAGRTSSVLKTVRRHNITGSHAEKVVGCCMSVYVHGSLTCFPLRLGGRFEVMSVSHRLSLLSNMVRIFSFSI